MIGRRTSSVHRPIRDSAYFAGPGEAAQAKRRIGDKVCFIGGFDQNRFFTTATPAETRAEVRRCFQEAGQGGGLILSPSDHFFEAKPELLHAFADEARSEFDGDVVLADCTNVHVQTEDRLVAAVGLTDVVIVDTPDAVLVCDRHASQKVKDVVNELKRRGHDTHRLHRTVARPWGTYTTLQEGRNFKIKRIEVKPGAALSLQMHHHRSEHWVVVSGAAQITNGEREFLINANESTYIPAGHKHRLTNPGIIDLVMIEVQSGEYLGEDDIVRFDDIYGRAPAEVKK